MDSAPFKAIGVIRTPFTEPAKTPIQGCFEPDSRGRVEIDPEYRPGLQDLEGFSHVWLLYRFHRSDGYELLTKPFLDKEKKGVFATRYCARPNNIGLSVVRLLSVEGGVLEVAGVDMLDGTPLLDVKPYVPRFDVRADARDGWFRTASEWQKYQKKDQAARPDGGAASPCRE